MKKKLPYEIELEPHKVPTIHPFSHPYGMPTTSKISDAGQPIREKNLSASKISNISSKIYPIRIQFEAGSK